MPEGRKIGGSGSTEVTSPTGDEKFPLDANKFMDLDTIAAFAVSDLSLATTKRGRVRAATTANITISTALNNADTLDGVTLATNDLVLVKNQSSAAENGIYVVGVTPARFAEYDTYNEHPGSIITVQEGTVNADTTWICTSNAGGTLEATAINFTGLAYSGTYTPTRSAESNLDSNVTMTAAHWQRVQNEITVAGRFTADPTAGGAASFEITLPVTSNIGAAEDVSGVAFCGGIAGQGAEIIGVAANDTAKVQWIAVDTTSKVWSYIFTYRVI